MCVVCLCILMLTDGALGQQLVIIFQQQAVIIIHIYDQILALQKACISVHAFPVEHVHIYIYTSMRPSLFIYIYAWDLPLSRVAGHVF